MRKLTLEEAASFLQITETVAGSMVGLGRYESREGVQVSIGQLKSYAEILSRSFFTLAAEYLASKWHQGQSYGDRPYTYHLDDVVSLVSHNFHRKVDEFTLELLIFVAWTHDLLEDTECPLEEVFDFVGDDPRYDLAVAAMKAISKGYFDTDESNEEYLIRLLRDPYAPAVKICDSESNLTHSIADGKAKLINKYCNNLAFISNHGFTTKSVKNLTFL